jgi:hypothetical protein
LGGAQSGRGVTSGIMGFCGLVLDRFRLIMTSKELSDPMRVFTFGRWFWIRMMIVRGIEDWKFFTGCCKPSETTEGGEGIGEYSDWWIEHIFLNRFLNGPSSL